MNGIQVFMYLGHFVPSHPSMIRFVKLCELERDVVVVSSEHDSLTAKVNKFWINLDNWVIKEIIVRRNTIAIVKTYPVQSNP